MQKSIELSPDELKSLLDRVFSDPAELDDILVFAAFLSDAAELVCEYFGGEVEGCDRDEQSHEVSIRLSLDCTVPADGGIYRHLMDSQH